MWNFYCRKYFLSLVLLSFCTAISTSNILVVSPVPSESHFKIGRAIVVGLANAGHRVTIVSVYDFKPQNDSKIQSVRITGPIERAEAFQAEHLDASSEMLPVDITVSMLFYRGADLCNLTLTDPKVRALHTQAYDLVIVEIFGTESLIGLGQMFDAPVIGYSPYSNARWTNLSPLPQKLNFADRITLLFHRIHHTALYIFESIALAYSHHPLQRSVYNNVFPSVKLAYDEARKNVALTFVNSLGFWTEPMTDVWVPNVIEIGGIHVERRTSDNLTLPQDIKQFIDSATDGVVYFSFGSILKGETLPTQKRNAFIYTFSKFKQKFIWKFEDASVPMPENVLTKGSFPQTDILGHSKVKAFISFGDSLGCIEAVYHGVPILEISFENQVLKRVPRPDWVLSLDYSNITTTSIQWSLNEILQNKYLQAARAVSKQHRNQPMTPMDTMVYWSEYVIRHKGAPHLHGSGFGSNYMMHSVDVFVIIFCFVMLSVYAVKWTMQKVFCKTSRLRVKVEKEQ